MTEFVQFIVRNLVDHPGDIHLAAIDGEKSLVLELRCHPNDIGKVIGKNGKTIGAIRTLLSTAAARQGRRAMIEVVE
ncbi:MAG: KH domain-containing protein [bacterium]